MKDGRRELVRFAPKGNNSFIEMVQGEVNNYFLSNNISPYATTGMWVKTVIMLFCYFAPLVLMITGVGANSVWLFWGLWFLMGWGMIGIGTSVMHDANHGTYSPKKNINSFIGYILEVIGGYTVNWKIQHNILHHTYTNISGLDDDINGTRLLRLSPQQPLYRIHRYQYLYAWCLYMIMTLYWMTAKDYIQVLGYKRHDLLVKQKISFRKAIFQITWYKMFYYSYILVLPLLFSGQPWYFVLVGFLIMHFTAGLFLSCVFQPSHIMPSSAFQLPVTVNGVHHMKDSWAIHELANTTDFAPRNRFLTWFIGGLNFQIEHHLFTDICHVHYRKIAPIVKSVAGKFGLPYHVQPTFLKALKIHARMLRDLGRKPR